MDDDEVEVRPEDAAACIELSVVDKIPADTQEALAAMPVMRTLLGFAARALVLSPYRTMTLGFDSVKAFSLKKPKAEPMLEHVADPFFDDLDRIGNDTDVFDDDVYDHDIFPHEGPGGDGDDNTDEGASGTDDDDDDH